MKHPYTKRKVCGKATKPKKLKQTNVSQTIKFSKKNQFHAYFKKTRADHRVQRQTRYL